MVTRLQRRISSFWKKKNDSEGEINDQRSSHGLPGTTDRQEDSDLVKELPTHALLGFVGQFRNCPHFLTGILLQLTCAFPILYVNHMGAYSLSLLRSSVKESSFSRNHTQGTSTASGLDLDDENTTF